MTPRSRLASMLLLMLMGLLSLSPADADDGKGHTNDAPDTPYTTINSAGPLENIFLGDDISAQIEYAGDSLYQVFPPGTIPGDYGTFVVVDTALYAPDFSDHGSTATSSLGTYTPFTPVSQSAVMGSGTQSDPYMVATVVEVGATGLQITQLDSYVEGQDFYRTDIELSK